MARVLTALLVSLLLNDRTGTQRQTVPTKATVIGHVMDTEGSPIENAIVLFHPDSAGFVDRVDTRVDVSLRTNAAGSAASELAEGFYDECVMAMAFSAQCRKIQVPRSGTIDHHYYLIVDPLVIARLGDKSYR